MPKFLEKTVKAIIYAAFFVPLIVLPASFIFPFIVPKIITFRIAAEIMAGAYALLLISNFQKYRPPVNFFTIAVGLFFLSFTLSTFLGVDVYHSFWDNHERMLGLFTLLHYGIFFVICSAMFKTWSEWRATLMVFLFAGSIVMLLGLNQVVNPYFLLNQGDSRIISTLGNSIYVGGYGLFLFFVSLLLALKEKNKVWRYVELFAGFLAFLGVFYSGSRGSFLGFSFGVFFVLVLYSLLLKEKEHRKARIAIWSVSALLVLLVGAAYAYRTTPTVQAMPALARALNTDWNSVKNSPRMYAWRIAVESFKEKPVFGWGPNNFFYAFNAHYNPKSLEHGYGETWFDNAHNIILNTLSVQGLFGILTYLGIFVAGTVILIRRFRNGELNREIFIFGWGFLLSHLVQNITVFENPTSYLYFMVWLAMIASLTRKKPEGEVVASDRPISNTMLTGSAVAVFIVLFVFNVQPARANMKTIETLNVVMSTPQKSVPIVKETLALNTPHIDDIRNDLGVRLLSMVSSYGQQIGAPVSEEILAMVEESLDKNIQLHPLDIRTYLLMQQLKTLQANMKMDISYIFSAEQYMTQALKYSPRRQQIIYNLSYLKIQANKPEEAKVLLEKAIADNPLIGESYWRLAIVYRVQENPQKIRETLDRGIKNNAQFNGDDKQVIADLENYISSTKKK